MTEPDRSPPGDALTQRYREASAQDARRPGAHVRDAVRAHAQMVIAAGRQAQAAGSAAPTPPAANQSRWKISALASLALAGLTGLLVLQFDRGTDEEKDLAFGQPSASAPPAAATAPSTPPAPATADAVVPQAPQADKRSGKARQAEGPPAEPKAPAAPVAPAAKKSTTQPSVSGSTAPKAEAEAARPLPPSPAPSPAAPPPPAPEIAAAQESRQLERSARQADSAVGGFTASPAPVPQAAPAAPAVAAVQPPAPVAAPAPAAPAAAAPAAAARAAAAAQEKRERQSPPEALLLKEAPGIPKLAGALQNAARAGNLPQVERLLQQGAALNAADAAGRTPLMLAAMQGHTAVVQRLLAAGANTALIDHDGLNALQHARRLGYDGIAHLIEAAR